eukprot:972958-Prorocentrum_minimum.AAC.2
MLGGAQVRAQAEAEAAAQASAISDRVAMLAERVVKAASEDQEEKHTIAEEGRVARMSQRLSQVGMQEGAAR